MIVDSWTRSSDADLYVHFRLQMKHQPKTRGDILWQVENISERQESDAAGQDMQRCVHLSEVVSMANLQVETHLNLLCG